MRYPIYRPRRVREQEHLRRMVRETHLAVDHLIYPLFVVPGAGIQQEIRSMPGTFHLSIDRLLEEVKEVQDLGIPGIILFGLRICRGRHHPAGGERAEESGAGDNGDH
jgi:porphobilinogen synthase